MRALERLLQLLRGKPPLLQKRERLLRRELPRVRPLFAGEEKCALLYPVEEWNKFMERIASDFEPQVRAMMMRYVQRNSAECSLDSQGRVVIPPQVREYAALSKEIVVVGEQTKVEIWSTDNWNEYSDDNFDETEIKKLLMQIGM